MAAISAQILPTEIPFGHVELMDIRIQSIASISMAFRHHFTHPCWGMQSVDLIKSCCYSPLIQIKRNQNRFSLSILNNQKEVIDFSGEPLLGEDRVVFCILNTNTFYCFPILRDYSPDTHYEYNIALVDDEMPRLDQLSLNDSMQM